MNKKDKIEIEIAYLINEFCKQSTEREVRMLRDIIKMFQVRSEEKLTNEQVMRSG